MIGFFIKKSFFDGWDNFLSLILINLGYTVLILGFLACSTYVQTTWLFYLTLVLLIVLFALYSGATSGITFGFSNYQREGFAGLKKYFVQELRHSLFFALLIILMFLCLFMVIPFYFNAVKGMLGMVLGLVVGWVLLFTCLALSYYFPLSLRMPKDSPTKTLRKCYLIMGDNFGFTLFFFLYSVIGFALSVVLATLIPSFGGFGLSSNVAIKLIMFKYDYLETEDADKKHIPWDELLFDEREKVGPRSLRGMIFPWKD